MEKLLQLMRKTTLTAFACCCLIASIHGQYYDANYSPAAPTIDGVINSSEWQSANSNTIYYYRNDNYDYRTATLYLMHDSVWLYVGVKTNIGSGSYVYNQLRFDGNWDYSLYGSSTEPYTDIQIDCPSPLANAGYDGYYYLAETTAFPVSAPSGTIKSSSGTTIVDYEYKVSLADLNTSVGSSFGMYMLNGTDGNSSHDYEFPYYNSKTSPSSYALINLLGPPLPLGISSCIVDNVTCNNDGQISVAVSGGYAPYSYKLQKMGQPSKDTTNMPSSAYFINLTEGTYNLNIKSADGQQKDTLITIDRLAQPLKLSIISITPDNGSGNGTLTVGISGGTNAYFYKYPYDTSYFATHTYYELQQQVNYAIYATDDNSCNENFSFYFPSDKDTAKGFEIMQKCPGLPINYIIQNNTSYLYKTEEYTHRWQINGKYIYGYQPMDSILGPGHHEIQYDIIRQSDSKIIFSQHQGLDLMSASLHLASGNVLCPGEKMDARLDNSEGAMMINWSYGDGVSYSGFDNWTNYVYKNEGTYNLSVSFYECGGSPKSIDTSIIVSSTEKPRPQLFSEHSNTFCPNEKIYFGTQSFYQNITWNFNNEGTSTLQRASYLFSTTGEKWITATVKNSCGVQGSDTVKVLIQGGLPVNADFWIKVEGKPSYNPETEPVCKNTSIQFNSMGNGASYLWEFGDGKTDTLPMVNHYFAYEDTFNVKLTVKNGCSNTNSSTRKIIIGKNYSSIPYAFIYWKGNEVEMYKDTFYACPNEPVGMIGQAQMVETGSGNLTFQWDFGDGTGSVEQNPVHSYKDDGTYYVTLRVSTACGASGYTTRWVVVNSHQQPLTKLAFVPDQICSGEKVYFFDDARDNYKGKKYIYSIDYGDGTSDINLTEPTAEFTTLAAHSYSGSNGTSYNITMVAKNACSNADTLKGIITINSTHVPFYYVENTASTEYHNDQIQDWGYRRYPADYEVTIPVRWNSWTPGMDSTFFVYFWYGKLDTATFGSVRPDGLVKFKTGNINIGDSVKAYIPATNSQINSFAIAAMFYCNSHATELNGNGVKGLPINGLGQPILSFPFISGSSASIAPVIQGGFIQLPDTVDPCLNVENVQGSWTCTTNKNITASFEDYPEYNYYNINSPSYNNSGDYLTSGDSIVFDYGYAAYKFTYVGNNLLFTLMHDPDTARISALNGKLFAQNGSGMSYNNMMACPGDPVRFKIGGGQSYQWNFGDGPTEASTTNTEVFHSYATAGTYHAYVVATNCSRTDTIHTEVVIVDNATPEAYFGMSKYPGTSESGYEQFEQGDSIYLQFYGGDPDKTLGYTFNWKVFRDGKEVLTSTEMNPKFKADTVGNYHIEFKVTNGCGSNISMKDIFIKEKIVDRCDSRFTYIQEGNVIKFNALNSLSGIKYYWEINGYTFNTPNPSVSIQDIYSVYAYLTITDPVSNCSSSSYQNVYIQRKECSAGFSYTVDNPSRTVTFTDTSKNATYYEWNFGDGIYSSETNPVHTYSADGFYWVELYIKDAIGICSNYTYTYIKVGNPDCQLYYSYYNVEGSTYQFNSQFADGSQYTWVFGDGDSAFVNNPVHTFLVQDTIYNIKLSAVKAGVCFADTIFKLVVDTTACKPDFKYEIVGNTVNFTYNANRGQEFNWYFGDYLYDTAKNPVHVYSRPGMYEVYLWMYDSIFDCSNYVSKTIVVGNVTCYAAFSYNSLLGNKIQFIDNSINAAKWLWSFGDGTQSTEQNPIKDFSKAGVYDVCLTTTDATGTCTQKQCLKVTVGNAECKADFNFRIDNLGNLSITNLSSNVNTYYWSFGDGGSSEEINPSYLYTSSGLFNICLFAYNSENNCYSEICKDVKVSVAEQSITFADFAYYVDGDSIRFTNLSEGASKSYWTFGDGTFNSQDNPVKKYPRAGLYNVCLKIFNSTTGESNQKCELIKVGAEECTVTASFSYLIQDVDRKVIFSNKSTGSYDSYYWDFGDGTTSSEVNPTHQYAQAGFFLVSLAVKKSGTECVDYYADFLQIGAVDCKAAFDYVVDQTGTVTFTNKSTTSGTANYYWYFDDGNFSTDVNPVHNFANGMHYVFLTVADASGTCMDYKDQEIQVGDVDCSAEFSTFVDISNLTVTCKNKTIGKSTEYYWYFGDGSVSSDTSPVHKFDYPGYYTISLTTFDENSWCMDQYETEVLVSNPGVDCQADFFYKVDNTSKIVKFSDNSKGSIVSYLWDFGDDTIPSSTTGKTPEHTYKAGGYYNVCLSVTNNLGISNMNCKWVKVAADMNTDCNADFNFKVSPEKKLVKLVSKSLGNPSSFEWDFGDENQSTKKDSATHTYADTGYYLVALHITTADGCESNTYKLINVGKSNKKISADFGYDAKHYNFKAGGYPVDFGGAGIGDNSRLRWTFGDGSENSTSMTPVHVYLNPGQYEVCFEYADSVTHQTAKSCKMISTEDMCQGDTVKPVAQCKDTTIVVTGAYLDIQPTAVDDSSSDDCGLSSLALDNQRFYPANEGENTIHLTVTDYNNNKSTCSATVFVISGDNVKSFAVTSGLKAYPNPIENMVTVMYNLSAATNIDLAIYDLLGKRVTTIVNSKQDAGLKALKYDASALKNGSYILQLKTSSGDTNRVVIVKK